MTRISLLLVLYFFISAAFGQKTETPYVILVSFDGFRPDYVEKFNLPNFRKFIHEGASAEGLIPSFPSKTFPNHYTLVTGLAAERGDEGHREHPHHVHALAPRLDESRERADEDRDDFDGGDEVHAAAGRDDAARLTRRGSPRQA
jgi:hypothetical protein